MNFKAYLNTTGSTARTLPIVILYVTEGCNLKCITCSYRDAIPGELTFDEIKKLAADLNSLGLRHIVYSGGEPLLRRDFIDICDTFASLGVKQSILTNGLLLEKRVKDIYKYFTEIIVSVDGANADTHNRIRGLNSFDQILKGIQTAVSLPNRGQISIRSVVQKSNFRQIKEIVKLAKSLGVNRVSFLSADVASDAFGRDTRGTVSASESILLDENEVKEFKEIVTGMFAEFADDFSSGFISESPAKVLRLVDYFEACLGKSDYPINTCNAPNVSAVITSTGDVHPCYFLPSYGNIRKTSLRELINSASIKDTRVKVKNYELERCKTCVCTLKVTSKSALYDKF